MWHPGSKYRRLGTLMKANHKQLKADLASGVRKLGSLFLALKLGEFQLFDDFFDFSPLDFPDLDNFQDFDVFWPFDFSDFIPSPSTPSLPSPSSTSSEIDLSGGVTVFSIEVSGAAILLNPWINCRQKLAKPRKTWMSCINFGSGHFLTTSICSASIFIFLENTIYPRKQFSSRWKRHFFRLAKREYSQSWSRTQCTTSTYGWSRSLV